MENNKTIELVLNTSGAVYHLNLKPGEVADTIFLVGDPGRAQLISTYSTGSNWKNITVK
jgi:uridine phosphorylase